LKYDRKTFLRVKKLTQLLQGKSYMLIVMQDNPDPDSIAAAVALRKLANSIADVPCTIACGGTVGRAENRALVRYLGLKLHRCSEIEFEKFDLIGMVDTQPGTGNNSLPEGIMPDIVIDHHPLRRSTREAELVDIRSRYGATATVLLEYLKRAGITPEAQLATALLYAIRSDTQDLGREASKADIEAVTFLYPIANKRMLGEIQRGSVERGYFQMLAEALKSARVYGSCIIAGLGAIDNPDMIAEVADLLLRDDETMCTICYGFAQSKMLLSVRTCEPDMRADRIIRQIVARRGTGGGHQTYAGGQIPLKSDAKSEITKLEKAICRKIMRILGLSQNQEQSLVQSRPIGR